MVTLQNKRKTRSGNTNPFHREIVGIVYTIPILIVWILAYGSMLMGLLSGSLNTSAMDNWTPDLGLTLLMYVIEIIVAIILPVASIRFARTSSFSEAFNFSAIVDTIKKIGWINYLVAIVLIAVIIGIPTCILIFGLILEGGNYCIRPRISQYNNSRHYRNRHSRTALHHASHRSLPGTIHDPRL